MWLVFTNQFCLSSFVYWKKAELFVTVVIEWWNWNQGFPNDLLHEADVDEADDPDDTDAAHAGTAGGEAEVVKGASTDDQILRAMQTKT